MNISATELPNAFAAHNKDRNCPQQIDHLPTNFLVTGHSHTFTTSEFGVVTSSDVMTSNSHHLTKSNMTINRH
jgi:hypothetical protein